MLQRNIIYGNFYAFDPKKLFFLTLKMAKYQGKTPLLKRFSKGLPLASQTVKII
jgi:hypothetical protein